jgi:hypothetical protein
MTVVLQHQFWDLTVTDSAFEVGLSFKGIPERLVVPFRALKSFVDPHASFGLKFDPAPTPMAVVADEPEAEPVEAAEQPQPTKKEAPPAEGGAVVSLDAFRKKNG